MRRITTTILAVIAATIGLAVTTVPIGAAASPVSGARPAEYGACAGFPNVADIYETHGSYGISYGAGDVGDSVAEIASPGWDVCTYQHADGSWNLYIANGNEISSTNDCSGRVVIKAAGSTGTAWTQGGSGPNNYTWKNNYCSDGGALYLAGPNNGSAFVLCSIGGFIDCNNGEYKAFTDNYANE